MPSSLNLTKAEELKRIPKGKPLIQRVYERVKKSGCFDGIIVATDDRRIFDAAEKFGARAVMTSRRHPSGTDRMAEAVRNIRADVVVNIQGVVLGFVSLPVRSSEFFLVRNVGMVRQDQDPDPNDAQLQSIDDGMVGGVPIVAVKGH